MAKTIDHVHKHNKSEKIEWVDVKGLWEIPLKNLIELLKLIFRILFTNPSSILIAPFGLTSYN